MDPQLRRLRQIGRAIVPAALRPPLKNAVHQLALKISPGYRYSCRVQAELDAFTKCQSTTDLPAIMHYWSNKYLVPMMQPFGFTNCIEMFRTYIARAARKSPDRTISILSVGGGEAPSEINVAQWLLENGIRNFRFDCVDINRDVLARGKANAVSSGVSEYFTFAEFDINTWTPSKTYDIVLAIQFLHHVVELELLFKKISDVLAPDGFFLTDDMIGRNGHMRWPEALSFVEQFWQELPEKYKFHHTLRSFDRRYENRDCSTEGFEGIRAQDVLPLLVRNFNFDFFFAFGNVIDPFVDRGYGPNFDPANETDREFIDRVHALDMKEIEAGRIKPTHIMAAMTKRPVEHTLQYRHLSPDFCIRRTDDDVPASKRWSLSPLRG